MSPFQPSTVRLSIRVACPLALNEVRQSPDLRGEEMGGG